MRIVIECVPSGITIFFIFGFQLMSMSLHEIGIMESTPPHIARIGNFTSFKAI